MKVYVVFALSGGIPNNRWIIGVHPFKFLAEFHRKLAAVYYSRVLSEIMSEIVPSDDRPLRRYLHPDEIAKVKWHLKGGSNPADRLLSDRFDGTPVIYVVEVMSLVDIRWYFWSTLSYLMERFLFEANL